MTDLRGIGMTSQRTRMRLLDRLRSQGITNQTVLDAIGEIPRHLLSMKRLLTVLTRTPLYPLGLIKRSVSPTLWLG